MSFQSYLKKSFQLYNFNKTDKVAKTLEKENFPLSYGFLGLVISYTAIILISITAETIVDFSWIYELGLIWSLAILVGVLIGATFSAILFSLLGYILSHVFIKLFKGVGSLRDTISTFLILQQAYLVLIVIITLIEYIFFVILFQFVGRELANLAALITAPIEIVAAIYYMIIVVKTFAITHKMGVKNAFLAGLSLISLFILIGIIITVIIFIIAFTAMAGAFGL